MTGPPVVETPAERYRRLYGGGVADTTRPSLSPTAQEYLSKYGIEAVSDASRMQGGAPSYRPPRPPLTRGERVSGAVERVLQTINPFQDELTGAMQAAGSVFRRSAEGRVTRPSDLAATYNQERDASRDRLSRYAEDSPVSNAAATLGGILPTIAAAPVRAAAGAAAAIPRGVGILERGVNALRAGGRGALEAGKFAAPYAFGAAEGTPGEQAKQTAVGTLVAGGLGGVAGTLFHPIAARQPRGSLAANMRTGGTDVAEELTQRAALVPEVRAATPALANVGPVETAAVNRTLRTKEGAKLGRTVERQLNRLDAEQHAVGEAKSAMFRTPQAVDDPVVLKTLNDALEKPAFAAIVKHTQRDMAKVGKVVGDVEKPFSGTIGEALAAGIPEADIIAKASDPKLMAAFLGGKSRAAALAQPVAKGFTYVEKNPYTLEFFDRLQRTARKVLDRDYKAGGTAATELVDTVNDQLVQRVRDLFPEYNALQTKYAQYGSVLEDLEQKLGPRFNPKGGMGKRYKITAHPGRETPANTNIARAGADPFTQAGQVSARIGLIRGLSQKIPNWYERQGAKELLKTGEAGTKALAKAGAKGVSRVNPKGYRMAGLGYGILGPKPDDEDP